MKLLIFSVATILILFSFCCQKIKQEKFIIKIDNYKNKNNIKIRNSNYKITFLGYYVNQSRYMSDTDELDEDIKKLYREYNIRNFTSDFTFMNKNKDSLFTFPIREISKKHDLNQKEIIKIYSSVLYHREYGKVIIIDSIR